MINKILKNEKGAFSILAVILVFIVVLAITAFTDITSKSYVINEIQGNMDISGINALQGSVDTLRLRAEQLATDASSKADTGTGALQMSSSFKANIDNRYDTEFRKRISSNSTITKIEHMGYKVDFTYDVWGFGTSAKKRPQIVLDETYKITIRTSSKFDVLSPVTKSLWSARETTGFTVSYGGTNSDGNAELIVRSVTREVYR
jgi:hypothetical protein